MWAFLLLMFAGAVVFVASAMGIEQWLAANDPSRAAQGRARPLPRRVLGWFSQARRYSDLRGDRPQDTLLVSTFWGGAAMSSFGVFGLLLLLVVG